MKNVKEKRKGGRGNVRMGKRRVRDRVWGRRRMERVEEKGGEQEDERDG